MSQKRIVVTGGNAGIGFALCRQLAADHGCHVYLGSRSADKGAAAVSSIVEKLPAGCAGKCELLELDVASDASVGSAVAKVKASLGADGSLYAVVNNAGTGLNHGVTSDAVVNTNLYGVKRMCEGFLPLINATEGRIVNVGSGAGPSYVAKCEIADQKQFCGSDMTWAQIEEHAKSDLGGTADTMGGYGLSKALMTCYTMLFAKEHSNLKVNACSPGFIDTAMTKGFGASKTPDEGTVAIKHLLFGALEGNGWYYGSDAVRSPLHFMRNPGEPAYTGELPF
mmetsp:Transcript_61025/g.134249  ORF Transcript_61025/g.134249 Transcript_61025/m.134249 type:complete len:281 (+) Transcript_61025:72-914(+)